MGHKIISIGASVAETISPLPVTIMGGEVAILAGAEVPAIWSGPWGYYPDNVKQVTSDAVAISSVTATADAGATASDTAFDDGEWTVAGRLAFLNEFPLARPGLLYGMLFLSTGNNHAMVEDMYSTSQSSITVRRNRNASDYHGNYFSTRKLFEPKVSQGGLWMITFPKPIPFHLGLRVGWDNGQGWYYFLYSLDPSFE